MRKYIDNPEKLRKCSITSVQRLINPLRRYFIVTIPRIGGHYASSLGVLELTLALHYVFNTPYDPLIWDTGHQAYFHKMLTGRLNRFDSLRKQDGISGFLKRSESRYDSFGAGHAGTSISAALGMAEALKNDRTRKVVAVIGDAALASGMAFEALNHAGEIRPENLIIIVNDNGMSISENVGALHFRPEGIELLCRAIGFNFHRVPDGHNFRGLVDSLTRIKFMPGPHIVQVHTIKGKGISEAEADPEKWHAVSSPAPAQKVPDDAASENTQTFTEIFARTLSEMVAGDKRIIAISAGMKAGTGLSRFADENPAAFYDVGICEQHAVTFAAGMACQGFRPVCAIYSTFLQRAIDQIIHDVCIQNLPVIFALDRAGVVGADGETHQGVFDLALLRAIPNLTIMAPADGDELRDMLYTAFSLNRPVAIRYPKAATGRVTARTPLLLPIGEPRLCSSGDDALILTIGSAYELAMAARRRAKDELNLDVAVVDGRFVKPLAADAIRRMARHYRVIAIVEDHALHGGFGSAVLESLSRDRSDALSLIRCFGVGDQFVPHATQEQQRQMNGFDSSSIFEFLKRSCTRRNLKAAG